MVLEAWSRPVAGVNAGVRLGVLLREAHRQGVDQDLVIEAEEHGK